MGQSSKKQSKSKWTGPLFGLIGVSLLIWGLVSLSQPDANLEPYDRFKQVSNTTEEEESAPGPQTGSQENQTLAQAGDDTLAGAMDEQSRLDLEKEIRGAKPKPPSGQDLPRQTLEHLGQGIRYSEQGKFNHADLEFQKAADLSPNSPEVYSIWATSMRMAEKYEGAERKFQRAHDLAPDDAEITLNWGMARLFANKNDGAIELFKETLELDPKSHLAWNYLGKAYGRKKDYGNEAKSYEKALELKEDFAQAHFNLGVTRSLQERFEDAAPHFVRAIELDPQFEKPFVVQFLTAMGLRDKTNIKEAKLKKAEEDIEQAALDEHQHGEDAEHKHEEAKKSEGSDHDMEGSKSEVVSTITQVSGRVTVNGKPPGKYGVVYLETSNKMKVPKQKADAITIDQKGNQFLPPHSVVLAGSTVTFANQDMQIHNIFSRSQSNKFNLGSMNPGTEKTITFETAGPVVLRCNRHKDMVGTLFVAPNGYVTNTDEQGRFEFPVAKSQEYRIGFWHPRLRPEEVEANIQVVKLTGEDKTVNFDVTTESNPADINDLVDPTDYMDLVAQIETEVYGAIDHWKAGKKYSSRKRMLTAITRHFDGGGLKDAIAKSFSTDRSQRLEDGLDRIRKQIAGLDKSAAVTEASLKTQAKEVIAQLRQSVNQLEHRLDPQKTSR